MIIILTAVLVPLFVFMGALIGWIFYNAPEYERIITEKNQPTPLVPDTLEEIDWGVPQYI